MAAQLAALETVTILPIARFSMSARRVGELATILNQFVSRSGDIRGDL
jgi:hypothetical protein